MRMQLTEASRSSHKTLERDTLCYSLRNSARKFLRDLNLCLAYLHAEAILRSPTPMIHSTQCRWAEKKGNLLITFSRAARSAEDDKWRSREFWCEIISGTITSPSPLAEKKVTFTSNKNDLFSPIFFVILSLCAILILFNSFARTVKQSTSKVINGNIVRPYTKLKRSLILWDLLNSDWLFNEFSYLRNMT